MLLHDGPERGRSERDADRRRRELSGSGPGALRPASARHSAGVRRLLERVLAAFAAERVGVLHALQLNPQASGCLQWNPRARALERGSSRQLQPLARSGSRIGRSSSRVSAETGRPVPRKKRGPLAAATAAAA